MGNTLGGVGAANSSAASQWTGPKIGAAAHASFAINVRINSVLFTKFNKTGPSCSGIAKSLCSARAARTASTGRGAAADILQNIHVAFAKSSLLLAAWLDQSDQKLDKLIHNLLLLDVGALQLQF
jgi:hypothetical protein